MTATHDVIATIPTIQCADLSLELGQRTWKLAFTVGLGQKPRLRTIAAEDRWVPRLTEDGEPGNPAMGSKRSTSVNSKGVG